MKNTKKKEQKKKRLWPQGIKIMLLKIKANFYKNMLNSDQAQF